MDYPERKDRCNNVTLNDKNPQGKTQGVPPTNLEKPAQPPGSQPPLTPSRSNNETRSLGSFHSR
jgi:hypothetical protein